MAENVMYICGLSMEMELAEEMGWIGKCKGCQYAGRRYDDNEIYCEKKGKKIGQRENCKEWVVNHR